MKPLSTTIPDGWNAEAWVDYLRTRAHRSEPLFPQVAKWFMEGARAVERAHVKDVPSLSEKTIAVFHEMEKNDAGTIP